MVWGRVWSRFPRGLRKFPGDLAIVLLISSLTALVLLAPVLGDTPLRLVVALGFVLVVPGYAFVAALFPGEDQSFHEPNDRASRLYGRGSGITCLERIVLSFGLSVTVTTLVGFSLTFTPWGITLVPVLVSLETFTVVFAVVAAVRRWRLPPGERFTVPFRSWVGTLRGATVDADSRLDGILNLLVVASIVVAAGTVGYALADPRAGERFTELYLLTESENGTLVAADYPTEFVRGESRSLFIGVDNREHRTIEYTIVVELQRVRIDNNTVTVLEENELKRFSPQLAHGEDWRTRYDVTPTIVGKPLRLVFVLYRGNPPTDSSVESAYLETRLWIEVSPTEDG